MKKLFLALSFLLTIVIQSIAQDSINRDSLSFSTTLGAMVYSSDFAPFFLVHNRWGEIGDEQTVFSAGELAYSYSLNDNWNFESGFSFRNEVFSSYYAAANYGILYLRLGAYKEQLGGLASDIGVVSYGLGRNARPVPMIELGMNNYFDVPFTYGYVQFKAHIGQRWLETDRYISRARMHSKDVFVRINLEREIGLKVSSGLIHFAQYGGTDPMGNQQPSGFDDFMKVFFGQGIPNELGGTAGESNAVGNHLGMIEIGFEKNLGDHRLNLDYQSPFEDQGSMQMISLKNYLLAFQWLLPKESKLIKEVMVEFTKSKRQSGPGLPDPAPHFPDEASNFGREFGGRDDYHNNYLYRSGYSYYGMSMGNALFLTYDWTQNFLEPYPSYNALFSNNRIVALTLGVKGELSSMLEYRLQLVSSKNFGTYAGLYQGRFNWGGVALDPNYDYVFRNGKRQYYSLLDIKFNRPFRNQPIDLNIMLAFDSGELYTNTGAEISFSYSFVKN